MKSIKRLDGVLEDASTFIQLLICDDQWGRQPDDVSLCWLCLQGMHISNIKYLWPQPQEQHGLPCFPHGLTDWRSCAAADGNLEGQHGTTQVQQGRQQDSHNPANISNFAAITAQVSMPTSTPISMGGLTPRKQGLNDNSQ